MIYFIHRHTKATRSCEDPKRIDGIDPELWEQVSHDHWYWQREQNDRQARERIAREDSHDVPKG